MSYIHPMRPLWPIEREVLEITATEYPASHEVLRRQIEGVQVVSFENSGAGFFSNLAVSADAPRLVETSPLSGAQGDVVGIEHGMGFIVFLREGRISMIEGYCNGDTPTQDFDFSGSTFELRPWSANHT